jgi:hypothetical protein
MTELISVFELPRNAILLKTPVFVAVTRNGLLSRIPVIDIPEFFAETPVVNGTLFCGNR